MANNRQTSPSHNLSSRSWKLSRLTILILVAMSLGILAFAFVAYWNVTEGMSFSASSGLWPTAVATILGSLSLVLVLFFVAVLWAWLRNSSVEEYVDRHKRSIGILLVFFLRDLDRTFINRFLG